MPRTVDARNLITALVTCAALAGCSSEWRPGEWVQDETTWVTYYDTDAGLWFGAVKETPNGWTVAIYRDDGYVLPVGKFFESGDAARQFVSELLQLGPGDPDDHERPSGGIVPADR